MIVRPSKRFERQVETAIRWGQEHHGLTVEIVDALDALSKDLALFPDMHARAQNARTPGLRRAYLPRIGYHVYYRVDERRGVVLLRDFRHAKRRPVRL